MLRYDYVAWEDEGVWTAHAPGLPGVYGIGSTRGKAVKDLFEASEELIDYLEEIGQQPPKPRALVMGTMEIG